MMEHQTTLELLGWVLLLTANGGMLGWYLGRRSGILQISVAATETTMELMRELRVEPREVAEALRKIRPEVAGEELPDWVMPRLRKSAEGMKRRWQDERKVEAQISRDEAARVLERMVGLRQDEKERGE